jgi:hypothetical protein
MKSNQIKLNAAARLQKELQAKAPSTSDWWSQLPAEQQEQYIEQHPRSKYAKDKEAEDEQDEQDEAKEPTEQQEQEGPEVTPEHRAELAKDIRSKSSKIAKHLKSTFPMITEASSALKHLVTGKPLTHEHKEVLVELGGLALKAATAPTGGAYGAKILGKIGITAVHHALDHFKKKKEEQPNKDDVEVFVDSIADGVEHAKAAGAEKTGPLDGAKLRHNITKHLKASVHHTVQVLEKSFKDIKPAVHGLHALSHGHKLEPEQKKAIINLGNTAVNLSIAALPGGLPVHLAAGLGKVAISHALKVIRKHDGSKKPLLHRFVESIGEGLEDELLDRLAGGGEGKE